MNNLMNRVFNTPLLIHPQKLDVIMMVLGPRLGLAPFAADGYDQAPQVIRPNADGVAVISVYGTLVKRSGGINAASGMTSYADIQNNVANAIADPRVKSLLLDIDSPGGEANGLFDLCEYLIAQRGRKPITAHANDFAYSAAYAIASCADRVVVTSVGGVGSIGVYMLHCDQSGADDKAGLKYSYVFSGDRKVDANAHEPLSGRAIAEMQTEANRVRMMFVDTVARNRGVSPKAIYDTQAATYMGADAVPLLADVVGSFGESPQLETARAKQRLARLRGADAATAAARARFARLRMSR